MTSFLPSVVRAQHIDEFRVHLTFNDGVEAIVDFERWLNGPVFESIKTPPRFSELFIDGGGVAWPNGADISPEALYEAAVAAQSETGRETTTVREKRAKYSRSSRRRG